MKHRLSKTTRTTAVLALLTARLFPLLPALRGDDAKQAVAPVADGVVFRTLILANFQYTPFAELTVQIPLRSDETTS